LGEPGRQEELTALDLRGPLGGRERKGRGGEGIKGGR